MYGKAINDKCNEQQAMVHILKKNKNNKDFLETRNKKHIRDKDGDETITTKELFVPQTSY